MGSRMRTAAHASAKAPSQRQLRVGELIRHALAELLARGEVHDPDIEAMTITIPEVRMSPDLKLATCYVMPLGGRDAEKAVAALQRNQRYLRGAVGRTLTLRYTPDLRFRVDDTFAEGDRIDALLRSDKVRRDTGTGGPPGDD
ncbi:MAG: 30S ribosome-binding factor RbfA [Bauldia sp.]|nr:30S ribosome-binding factor RbfA [Bauldia sp.]